MRCPYKPRWMDKMFNIYSFTALVRIENEIIKETTYSGYLNLFGYNIRLKLYIEKVRWI